MTRPPLKPRKQQTEQPKKEPLEGDVFAPDGTLIPSKFTGGKGSFRKGMKKIPGSGRKKGQQNKISTLLKEEIIRAAQDIGENGDGLDELRGYLRVCARHFPKSYMHLLARVLPYQVNATVDHEHRVFRTREEIEAEMRRRGLPIPKSMFN
ncbi:MAG TPA: hypothetical protein VHA37_01780 [Candidatus Saccharimonadales bacterium]|nr:hypothetical protein [Candidatus Saccharimonadales bacterium]